MSKRKKKRVNKGKFFRFIFIMLLFIALIISFFLFTPFFNINKVTVLGNEAVETQEIVNKSGIKSGMNIFRADVKGAKKNLLSFTMLDDIKIKRKLPGKIEIVVTETYPQIIIPYMTGFVSVNEKGKVIQLMDKIPEDNKLPLISGVEIETAKAGEQLKAKDEVSFSMIMDCVSLMREKKAIEQFKSLDFSNLSNFIGYTHNEVKIIFGKLDDMEYKISFLSGIIPNVQNVEGAYIDISSPESGIYGNSAYEEEKEEQEENEKENEEDSDENTDDEAQNDTDGQESEESA